MKKLLEREAKESRYKTSIHARNVGWRVIKDWIEAQLALVETGMVEIGEVFLPYQLTDGKVTVYERVRNVKMLSAQT